MKIFTHTVADEFGLHARPIGQLVKLTKPFASSITIDSGEKSCDMKKLMAFMSMGIKQGESVVVSIDGEDEEACYAAVFAFFKDNNL